LRVLLDTCTLAEIRKPDGHAEVKAAVRSIPDRELYLSVLTVGEVAKGVALLPASRKKQGLATWLLALEAQFADRILAIDRDTARIWGELTARARKAGVVVPTSDGLIAATALQHGLYVMTRNSRDFAATGVLIIDPWLGG
jgi:predicted nucleic acid-binding protein